MGPAYRRTGAADREIAMAELDLHRKSLRSIMRRFSPSKLALSALAAALFAFAVIGRPLTAPLPNTIRSGSAS